MLSQTLKKFRENCGYTQQQVADALNIDRSTYAYYELGKTTPDVKVIVKLSKIFNVSFNELLESEGPISKEKVYDSIDDLFSYNFTNYKNIYELTKKEKTLISLYRVLSSQEQEDMLDSLKEKIKNLSKENND